MILISMVLIAFLILLAHSKPLQTFLPKLLSSLSHLVQQWRFLQLLLTFLRFIFHECFRMFPNRFELLMMLNRFFLIDQFLLMRQILVVIDFCSLILASLKLQVQHHHQLVQVVFEPLVVRQLALLPQLELP